MVGRLVELLRLLEGARHLGLGLGFAWSCQVAQLGAYGTMLAIPKAFRLYGSSIAVFFLRVTIGMDGRVASMMWAALVDALQWRS